MTKAEYLKQLEKHLKKLPPEDYENAMEYFREYFDEIIEDEDLDDNADADEDEQ